MISPANAVRPAPLPWKQRLPAMLGAGLIGALSRTLRVRVHDRAGILDPAARPRPMIWCIWHNRLFILPHVWRSRFPRADTGVVLTSASGDGEWIARIVGRFGLGAVRGSAPRRGLGAMRDLLGLLGAGVDMAITPDGSRGPRYHLKPGIVLLAAQTGAAVIPIGVELSSAWRLRSWDAFMIPRPFARAEVTFGEPLRFPPDLAEADFESARLRLENAMKAINPTV